MCRSAMMAEPQTDDRQTVRDLFQMDNHDHHNAAPLQHTEKQHIIITVAQRNMDKSVSEFAEDMNASEAYIRDVLIRTLL